MCPSYKTGFSSVVGFENKSYNSSGKFIECNP